MAAYVGTAANAYAAEPVIGQSYNRLNSQGTCVEYTVSQERLPFYMKNGVRTISDNPELALKRIGEDKDCVLPGSFLPPDPKGDEKPKSQNYTNDVSSFKLGGQNPAVPDDAGREEAEKNAFLSWHSWRLRIGLEAGSTRGYGNASIGYRLGGSNNFLGIQYEGRWSDNNDSYSESSTKTIGTQITNLTPNISATTVDTLKRYKKTDYGSNNTQLVWSYEFKNGTRINAGIGQVGETVRKSDTHTRTLTVRDNLGNVLHNQELTGVVSHKPETSKVPIASIGASFDLWKGLEVGLKASQIKLFQNETVPELRVRLGMNFGGK